MDPTNSHVPAAELPQPQQEPLANGANQAPAAGFEQNQAQSIEQGSAQWAQSAASQAADDVAAQFQAPAQSSPQAGQGNASPHSPHIADDTDLIEKEWVMKAKHIVEQTKHDPYTQTREINKMKADYLKKRYAKDLKLPED